MQPVKHGLVIDLVLCFPIHAQICWTLFSIISGMIYFQEYEVFNPATAAHGPLDAVMFAVGVMVGGC